MDVSMLDAAGKAFVLLFDPFRMMLLALGCVMGLVLGILPGIGGLAGTALLLPFTFNMDPYAAMALLLGLGATTATGDPIPAILFGVPGGAGSAATVLDGLPLAKRGEASRALSAAYMSSMMGGIFGAALMAVLLPILRPIMLYIGSPELLAFAVLGISMVAVLSGSAPLRGLAAGCIGLMISMVGSDPQTGTLRWTLDSLYLWEGAPLVPIVLGLFALPELCDLAISRTSIAPGSKQLSTSTAGMIQGARDCFKHWWLVVRCSWLGAALGAVPGIGGAIVDWLAYGHALKTEKGASGTFGRGDIRGVIASESANNAKEGGSLIPTVAFGVPGSAGMAILLGAFLIHGLVPGPDMLTKNLDVTYAMVWSVALANILGAGLCYLFSAQFARLATLRYTLILPATLSIIYIGAFQGSRNWGDLYTLLAFGVLGWAMKMLKWPRPPLLLGVVLGEIVERYLFISIQRYGVDWFARPIVVVIFALAIVGLMRPFLQDVKIHGGMKKMLTDFHAKPYLRKDQLFYVFLYAVLGYMMLEASTWNFSAKIVPMIVGSIALVCLTISLLNQMFRRPAAQGGGGMADDAVHEIEQKIHMDLDSGTEDIPMPVILRRAAVFFGWLVAFMASMATIGLIPTVPIFVIAFMRLEETKERWSLVIPQAIILTIFVYILFDQLLTIPWPPTLLGSWFPALKGLIPSV
ncbi:MAG: tripartite tricarboxylate transporter TctA family protein [Hyphomicrobiales bacterium]|nr:tripartite tricarboxylate transporter TctA family protein [Hyphomicrobiales bacterium]